MKRNCRLRFLFGLLLMALSGISYAQVTNVDIGTGTSSSDNSPIQRFYDYSASELLYLSTEVNTSGNITGLGFYKASGVTTVTIDSVYIYLKQTTLTTLTTTANQSGYTLVYKGAFPNNVTAGWLTVNFTEVSGFAYTNASNLSVLIVRPYQAQTTSRPYWRYTDNSGARNGWYRNNTAAFSGTMNEVSTWRPNIRLIFTAGCSGAPTAGTTTSAATTLACNTSTTLSLNGNTTGMGIAYQWQYNVSGTWVNFGTNAATQVTPAVTQPTQFRCAVTCTSTGGGSANSVPVTINPNPIAVNLGNDTSVCPGVSHVLDAANAGATYLWNTNASTQSITTAAAGTFSVQVTLANGCKGADTIHIVPGIVPSINLPTTTNLCEGDFTILNAGNPGSSYVWMPGNITTQSLNVSTGGVYGLEVKSVDGCTASGNTNVMIRTLPVAQLSADTSICNGAQIVLDAGNSGYAFLWNNGANTQTITVRDSGTYEVTITTPYNCLLTTEQHVGYLTSPYVEGFNFIPSFNGELGSVSFLPINPINTNNYLWDFGDGSATSTQVNPVHDYTAAGVYTVTLTVSNDCGNYTVQLPLNVDLVTGITAGALTIANIKVYPNPAKEHLVISSSDAHLKINEITVVNLLGSTIYHEKCNSIKEHRLSVSKLTPGLYTIRVLTSQGYVNRKFQIK